MEKLVLISNKNDKLFNILSNQGFSFNAINKLLRKKDIIVNGQRIKENLDIYIQDEIIIFFDPSMKNEKKIDIVYEDENILIVNKPIGIEVEGENGLSNILKAIPVHRLDRNTTGLIIFAKNEESKEILFKSFKEHKIEKKYLAEVIGNTNFKNTIFNANLVKDSKNSIVKIYKNNVKNSVRISTIFNTIKSSPSSSIVECTLITGKTHQIRASLAYLGHAIIGDGKYGKNEDNKKFKTFTQKLHCYYLKINEKQNILSYLNEKTFIVYPDWYFQN